MSSSEGVTLTGVRFDNMSDEDVIESWAKTTNGANCKFVFIRCSFHRTVVLPEVRPLWLLGGIVIGVAIGWWL